MNIALWIVQILLALLFAAAGVLKLTRSREALIPQLPWVSDVSTPVLRLIGAAETAGAIGLILPAATGIATVLTPVAASGLGLIMVLAIGVHTRRKEPGAIVFNLVLLAAAVFIAWGRFGPHSL